MRISIKTIFILLCVCGSREVRAQLGDQDTLWIKDFKAGKFKLKLKPEFEKGFKDGSLMPTERAPEFKRQRMYKPGVESFIQKDFTEIMQPPPIKILEINPNVFKLPPGIGTKAPNLSGGSVSVSFDDALKSVFMPSERRKMKNKKKANAHKTY